VSSTQRQPLPRGGPGHGGPAAGLSVPVEKPADFSGSARRLLGRLGVYRGRLVAVVLLAAGSVAFTVVGPKLLGNATTLVFEGYVSSRFPLGATQESVVAGLRAAGEDTLADMVAGMNIVPGTGVDFTAVGTLLALTLVVYVLASLLSWAQVYVMAGVTADAMYALREEVDGKVGRLPLRYFDEHQRGDLLSRVTNDIDNIATTIQQVMMQLVTALLTVIGVLAMMFWLSPLLALVSLLVVPLSLAVTLLIARRSQPHFIAQWRWTGTLNGHVEEMTTGHDIVKLYNRQEWAVEEFDRANDALYQASFKAQFISGIIQPTMMFIGNLNYVLIAVIGGFRVATGQMPIGDVQAFIQYSRQFTMPITQIASVVNLMQSGIASAERVFDLLDAADESPDPADPARLDRVAGAVSFERVSFRYEPDRPLIDGLDLDVAPGRTIAIVGPTGAGKTTLVNLLMRFYDIDSGRITLDGADIAAMTRDDVRASFGMVLQDTWLFGGSIADNIAYGRAGATREDVERAAEACYVDHVVATMPDGYDTIVDEDAANLSAGEKQLITIARAFLADAPILILDEATSSVDTRTEMLIQEAMGQLRTGRTSFVIAHRLSTIRDADTILVLVDGAIVEQGDHEALLARDGHYAALYRSQFAGPMQTEESTIGIR
jgi:ATP-binding cassette subfamily B multidrug efflux pump